MARRWQQGTLLVLAAAGFFGLIVWIVSIKSGGLPVTIGRFLHVLQCLLTAGSISLVWLASALGWGRLWRPLLRAASHPWMLQFGCGAATMLWLDHALGWAGLLTSMPVAWTLAAIGIALLVHQVGNPTMASGSMARIPATALLAVPPLAILVVAASSIPGWLWDSEMFGFDALEYHLQLPAEWLVSGRLKGLHHNVYSYLPGYLEAAYLHIAAAFGSVHAAGGVVMLAAQFLHAELAIAVALMAGFFVAGQLGARGIGSTAALAGGLCVAVVLSPPYAQVDGSMAYNEMAVNLLLLAGLVAVLEPSMSAASKGAVVGWLSGVAAGVKLPAIFMVALPLGLLLALRRPAGDTRVGSGWTSHVLRRDSPVPSALRGLAPGAVVGFVALLPYFLRNALDTGNPVFPFATRLFGLGHWSPEQLERWDWSHHFTGSMAERLSLMWRHGFGHPLWSIFFALVAAAAIAVWLLPEGRSLGTPLILVILVQIVSWAMLTHLIARFLLPVLVPAGILIAYTIGLAIQRVPSGARRALAVGVACLAITPMTLASLRNVAAQRRGDPAQFVGSEAFDFRTGRYFTEHPDLIAEAPIEYTTNYALPRGSLVYFIGESRVLFAIGPKIYNSAWDHSVLGDLMRRFPDDPAQWARGLADLGVTHVRVSMKEIDRMQRVDKISDPLVSLAVVEGFLGQFGRLLARKDGISAIYELRPPPPPTVRARGTGAAPQP